MVACCTSSGACTVTTAEACSSSGGIAQAFGTTCATSNCPAAADYADFKVALAATAIVRYEYGASLIQRPRMLATLIALQRVAAANPAITAQQLDAFVFAYDARLRTAIPGDPDLARGANLMVAVRYPGFDLAPVPAGILDGIDTEIDQEVLADLGLDPYDTSGRDRSQQMEQFQLTPVGFLGNSGVIARALYKLFRGQDAEGGFHSGLVPSSLAYLATQPTWDSPTADALGEGFIGINPFPSPAELLEYYPAVASSLDALPPTPEEFAAQAASNGLEDVAQSVLGEMAQVTEFSDEKSEELRALLNSGYSSLAATRTAAQNAAIVQSAINERQADLRTLAERRAGIDIGVLAMQGAALSDANRALVLQEFSAVQLQVADSSASNVLTIIFGIGQIVGGAAIASTGVGTSYGVPIVISGVSTLLQLWGSSGGGVPEPEQQVLNELANIRDQIQEFQIDMQQRLNHIDAAINASYVGLSNQLDIIYTNIGADLSEVRTQLALHSSAMARFESNVYGMLENGFNYPFVADANLALGYRDRFMFDMRYTDNAPSDYQSYENTFFTYAFNQASLPPYVFGSAGATLPTLAELDFAAGNSGNPIGSRINLLRTVPSLLGESNLGSSPVANPTSWAVNADAHAQLHRENPWYTAANVGRWNQVRTKGQDAQNVMWAAKSQPLFDALFAQYAADLEALQADIENPATLHEWAIETSCSDCDLNLWPGNPLLQAAYLRWVAFKLTSPSSHHLKDAANAATRDIRLMDAFLAMACPGELDRNDLLRGMLRGDELGMDVVAFAQYFIEQGAFLETPGAIGLSHTSSLPEIFVRDADTESLSQRAITFGFFPITTFSTSEFARYSSAADLNNDGRTDLVTADGNGAVAIRLGNGDGTFQPAVSYPVGDLPRRPAIGDLNNDGLLDLAVPNGSSNTISVLRGNGNGTFQPATNWASGESPYELTLADVNEDGSLDLVVTNPGIDRVSIRLGNGNGTFQSRVTYTVGDNPLGVAVGDLNGDGWPDLVTANSSSDNISVRFGAGDGSFPTGVDYSMAAGTRSVAIGDIDADGNLDVVTANSGAATVSVRRGIGGGLLAAPQHLAMGANPRNLFCSDLNTDPCKCTGPISGAMLKVWQTVWHEQIQSKDGPEAA
jgi:hypothetical protein